MDEDRITHITDPKVMRALAHPARLVIMEQFFSGRTGTATEFAELCGLSPSATSYHLRALAKVGMAEEAPSRGDGRERVWQTPIRTLNLDTGADSSDEAVQAAIVLTDAFLERENVRAREYLGRVKQESADWRDAVAFSEAVIVATADELTELNKKIMDMIRPYARRKRPNPPPGARLVAATYRAFPSEPPGTPIPPLSTDAEKLGVDSEQM